jgi:uncharacterized protein YeaC (DUF1315 family)
MSYLQFIETMSPQIYRSLLRSVELGKWPDGKALTTEQRANAMQAIIAWGERHLAEPDRVGFIEKKQKSGEICDTSLETPLNWKE